MTKKELAKIVADKTGGALTIKDAETVTDAVISAIITTVSEVGEFSYHGFGKLYVHDRKPRKGRNPQTGESINIPASKTVKYKPAAAFKKAIS